MKNLRSTKSGRINRRKFLQVGGLSLIASGMGMALVACGEETATSGGNPIVPGVNPANPTPARTTPGTDLGAMPTATNSAATTGANATTAAAPNTTRPATGQPNGNPFEIAGLFLKAWEESRFSDMYGMLALSARNTITQQAFEQRYVNITAEATLAEVKTKLGELQKPITPQQTIVEIPFTASFKTGRVGDFSQENKIAIKAEDGRWKVDWSPAVIFKELDNPTYLVRMVRLGSERGNITSRDNQPITAPAPLYQVYVVPGRIENEEEVLNVLSQQLKLDKEKIKNLYKSGQPDWKMPIRDLPAAAATPEVLGTLRLLKGVGVDETAMRSYPQGVSAAHVVGYVNAINEQDLKKWGPKGYSEEDKIGRVGMEAWAEEILAGELGGRLTVIRRDSTTAATLSERAPKPAANLILTLDMGIQRAAETALGQKVGSIVVMDPNSGAVLALASFPSYDPNGFIAGLTAEQFKVLNDDPRRPFTNRAANGLLPTGSVFKAITTTAAIEYLGMNLQSKFTCTGRWTGLGPQAAKDCYQKSGHGSISLFEGLAQSCDIVYYELGKLLDEKDSKLLPALTKAFGLGSSTGLTGLSDSPGQVPDPQWKLEKLQQGWVRGDAVNLGIGQGYLLATPLQVAVAYSAFANGGNIVQPRLIERTDNPNLPVNQSLGPQVKGKLPVKPETLVEVHKGLLGVTQRPLGTARPAFAGSKVSVAGKTGTAESGQEEPHAWFACYAPADQPRYVVVVALENGGFGNEKAAPIARKVVDALPF